MLSVTNTQKETEGQSAALDHLRTLAARPDKGWAVLLRPSRLAEAPRDEAFARAIDAIAAQIRQFRGHVFELPGGDRLAVLSAGRLGQLRTAVLRLEPMLRADPLFSADARGGWAGFTAACDLQHHLPQVTDHVGALLRGEAPADPQDFQPLLVHETVRESAAYPAGGPGNIQETGVQGGSHNDNNNLQLSAAAPAEAAATPPALGPADAAAELSPPLGCAADEDAAELRNLDLDELTLNLLGPALRALNAHDLSRMLRSQPVCLLCDDGSMLPVYDEIYTSIADLEQATRLNLRRGANRWLLRHLTRILDRRVLSALRQGVDSAELPVPIAALRERLHARGNFALNLNLESVLSPQFVAFDSGLDQRLRGSLVLEFHKLDVLGDMAAFGRVRQMARRRGYRLCLDGVSHLSLPLLDRHALDVELVKVDWSEEMVTLRDGLRSLIVAAEARRFILCHCDSEEALDFGLSVGISLYQGRQVDLMLEREPRQPSFLWSLSAPPLSRRYRDLLDR
jgi:hypothetical protein